MQNDSEDFCRSCGREVPDARFVTVDDESFPTSFVFVSIETGRFAFCNLCFEAERFGGLTAEERVAVSELFASLQEGI